MTGGDEAHRNDRPGFAVLYELSDEGMVYYQGVDLQWNRFVRQALSRRPERVKIGPDVGSLAYVPAPPQLAFDRCFEADGLVGDVG